MKDNIILSLSLVLLAAFCVFWPCQRALADTYPSHWTNMPLTTSNPAFKTNWAAWSTFYTNTATSPMGQLWYAYVERQRVQSALLGWADQASVTPVSATYVMKFSNQVVLVTNIAGAVTNVYTYTNQIPVTTNLTMLFDTGANTNLLLTTKVLVHNESNNVVTQTVYFTFGPLLGLPYKHLFSDYVLNGFPMYGVLTNQAQSNTFNKWFSTTNPAGLYPTNFPYLRPGGLFYTELGASNVPLGVVSDAWGTAYSDDFRFKRDLKLRSLILSESACTNAAETNGGWVFRQVSTLPYVPGENAGMLFRCESTPVLTYQSTGCVPNITFSIGGAVATNSIGGYGYTNESRNILGSTNVPGFTNVILEYSWYAVTNITVTNGTPALGDTATIQYTNSLLFYYGLIKAGDQGPDMVPQELDANDFNERYKVLNALRWYKATVAWSNVTYYWRNTNVHMTSFADAYADCISSTPIVTTNERGAGPSCYTCYDYSIYNPTTVSYNAYAWLVDAAPVLGDGQLWYVSNYWREADIYIKAATYDTNGQFDVQNCDNLSPYSTNYYVFHHTVVATNQNPATNDYSFTGTGIPPNWFADPTTNSGMKVKVGWKISALGLYRFDLTNAAGFNYY